MSGWVDGYHCVLDLSDSVGCGAGSDPDDFEGVELFLLREASAVQGRFCKRRYV
jgi:hypothetical protein